MSLKLLFFDELKGFAKSKVMLVLWFGLPLLSFLMHFIRPEAENLSISFLVTLLVSSIGGTLSAIMLSTSIVGEKNRHVYELYLIRPVRRSSLLLAKFLSVYLCLIIAVAISFIVGIIIDGFTVGIPQNILTLIFDSLISSLSSIAISCSIGILFGVITSSIPVAAILSVYLGSQLSSIIILFTFFLETIDPIILTLLLGVSISAIIMTLNIIIFNRQQF